MSVWLQWVLAVAMIVGFVVVWSLLTVFVSDMLNVWRQGR